MVPPSLRLPSLMFLLSVLLPFVTNAGAAVSRSAPPSLPTSPQSEALSNVRMDSAGRFEASRVPLTCINEPDPMGQGLRFAEGANKSPLSRHPCFISTSQGGEGGEPSMINYLLIDLFPPEDVAGVPLTET